VYSILGAPHGTTVWYSLFWGTVLLLATEPGGVDCSCLAWCWAVVPVCVQMRPGEQDLGELARLTGFDVAKASK